MNTTDPVDLEALHFMVLRVLDYEIRTIPSDSQHYGPQREIDVADLQSARDKIAEEFAELTARRARDAEVEALVAALREAMEWNWLDEDARPSTIADQCDKALAPFTGAKP